MTKKNLPLSKVYQLLEPGPVVLLTTTNGERTNIMTMSWHTMMEFEPPLIGCVISGRNFSFELLQASGECAINIPTAKLADKVVQVGNSSGRKLDKFSKFGLTPVRAKCIGAPLIEECFANLECKLADTRLADDYNFFILQVVKAWIDPTVTDPQTIHHRGRGVFMLAGDTVKLRSKMK